MSAVNPPPGPGYFRVFENPAGGFVDVHALHGKQEKHQNLAIARWLASWGEPVCLLPVEDIPGRKSPDATRNGIIWEFKMPVGRTVNTIDNALRDGSKQASNILIQVPADFNIPSIEQALFDRVRRTANIQAVAILYGNYLVHLSRQEIVENTFRGKLT